MKSKLNLVKDARIGSWEGIDVIFTTQKEYDNFSDEKVRNKIYAFYKEDMPISTNMYMVRNDTVFAYILNEYGDIKLLRDDSFVYFGRLHKKSQKKEEPKGKQINVEENKKKPERGKRAEVAIQEEKVLGKSVDEWLDFAVSSSVEEYTRKLSKNVDEIIKNVES